MLGTTHRAVVFSAAALLTVVTAAAAQGAQSTPDPQRSPPAITNGNGSIAKNGINVPADRAVAILNNRAGHYFNVHTTLNPDGAIRGQLSEGTFVPGAATRY